MFVWASFKHITYRGSRKKVTGKRPFYGTLVGNGFPVQSKNRPKIITYAYIVFYSVPAIMCKIADEW